MLTLRSPAKVNLFLRVLERRPDGYHNLASLFQTISLSDQLHFSLDEKDLLTSNSSHIPLDHSNLILKAANLFRQKTGYQFGLRAHVEKNIPIQSGLGGGSSNAATTLWALNALFKNPVTSKELASWAAEIGSDISFFFSSGTAYCTGRGEVVEELPSLAPTSFWIIKPPEGLSTAVIYNNFKPHLVPARDPRSALCDCLAGNPQYFNDLEVPAFAALPSLDVLRKRLLDAGFSQVVMSGSGSSLFCIGHGTPPDLPNYFCKQTHFLNRHSDSWYS